jgi:FdhD protein
MNDFFLTRKIRRYFDSGKVEELDDDVIRESRLLIRLDDRDFIHAVCTPSQFKEFVIGFLRTRGLIDGIEDIDSVDITRNSASVIRTARLRESFPDLGVLETTGTRNVGAERFIGTRQMTHSDFRVSSGVLLKGMEELSRMPLYVRSGGTHCAVLFSREGNALASAEDIGRHNAVDKTIGGGMMKGIDFSGTWLAVSGRLPSDMVLKPLLVGIPLIASVSAATSEGIELGERSGLTVVGFARGGRLNCYCHPERITQV